MAVKPLGTPLRLGSLAPNFEADTTMGPISNFFDWKRGKWTILFSHSGDFTPVCTTEMGQVAKLSKEWESRNIKVVGLSCSSLESHQEWIKDINETQNTTVAFPIIADPSKRIATLYGMLNPDSTADETMLYTIRSVFVIDHRNAIRTIFTGRNFNEILRVIDALQLTDTKGLATPANWKLGDDVIIPSRMSDKEASEKYPGFTTITPYLRTTPMPTTSFKSSE